MATSTEMKEAANDPEKLQAIIDRRRTSKMARIDGMKPEVRECVHMYGFAVVDMLLNLGISKPRQIKHVVETILDEFSPTRGTSSFQGASRREMR